MQHRPRVDGHELAAQVSDTLCRRYSGDCGELTLLILAFGEGMSVKARGDILCACLELQILRLGASFVLGADFVLLLALARCKAGRGYDFCESKLTRLCYFRKELYWSLLLTLIALEILRNLRRMTFCGLQWFLCRYVEINYGK